MSQNKKTILAALVATYAFVDLVLMRVGLFTNTEALNYSIFFVVCIVAFFLIFPAKKLFQTRAWFDWLMIVAILMVGFSYTLFDNSGLAILNYVSIFFMLGVLFLNQVDRSHLTIDKKGFVAEYLLGSIVRPFASIHEPFVAFANRKRNLTNGNSEENTEVHVSKRKNLKWVFHVILGLVIGVPIIYILAILLSLSDAVFSSWMNDFLIAIRLNYNISKIITRIIVSVILLPFVASTFWTYSKKRFILNVKIDPLTVKKKFFPAVSGIVVLSLINILYIVFAIIQSVYLFSGWNGALPEGISYAEYARNGFFELAFVSVINLGLTLFFIINTHRLGRSGKILRILSLMLVAMSGIQIASALQRMRLYVEAYGLSEDRYLSTGLMFLIAIAFAILVIRELRSSFSFFKYLVAAAALTLIVANYSVPNARVAQYNIDKYLNGQLHQLDYWYLANQSADSLWVLIEYYPDFINSNDPLLQETAEMLRENIGGRAFWRIDDYRTKSNSDVLAFNLSKDKVLHWSGK